MDGLPIPTQAVDTLATNLIGAAFLVLLGVIIWLLIRGERRQREFDKALEAKDKKIESLYEQNRSDSILSRDKLEQGLGRLAESQELSRDFLEALTAKRPTR